MLTIDDAALSDYLSEEVFDEPVTVTGVDDKTRNGSHYTVLVTVRTGADADADQREYALRVENSEIDSVWNELGQEYELLDRLGPTGVPVPETIHYESDPEVFGERFYLTSSETGRVYATWVKEHRKELVERWGSSELGLQRSIVETIGEIHDVDPDTIPSHDTPSPDEIVDRELDRFTELYRMSAIDHPIVEEGFRWLKRHKPDIDEVTLVHGDFHLGNALFDDDRVQAVLDWETARISDPMLDIGYTTSPIPAGHGFEPPSRPELALSAFEREWFYEEYSRLTGRPVDRERVSYWETFQILGNVCTRLLTLDRYRSGTYDDVQREIPKYLLYPRLELLLDYIRDDRTEG